MELSGIGDKVCDFIKKYRYVLLILLLGIGLMLLPDGDNQEEADTPQVAVSQEPDISQQLSEILGQIQGTGQVKVMLTCASGKETIYQSNVHTVTEEGGFSEQRETVLFTNAERGEEGLIKQIIPEKYLGAVIVCQGADTPSVRLAIVEAVSDVTGLGADRISVLKMK